jgi:nitroreductase
MDMDFFDLIKKRKSCRHYEERPVEKEKIEKCLEAAFQAPSALNSQPWKFYVATGEIRDKLTDIISKYPIYIADLYDEFPELNSEEKRKEISEFAKNLGKAPVIIVVTMPETKNQNVRKMHLISCGAAIENFWLAATALGLGSVCLTSAAFIEKDLLEFLNVKGEEVVAVILLGYPEYLDKPKKRDKKAIFL